MRVILAEDSALLRAGLEQLLVAEGHEVLASVADAEALLVAVAATPPDVVVTDVRMPPGFDDEGIRAAIRIRTDHPDVAVLVLSQYVERRGATALVTSERGGIGYLLKDRVAHVDDFLDALDRVASGGTALDPEVVRQLLARTSHAELIRRLSPREHDVLDLMAEGHTNAAISARLFITASAVEKHANAIFTKLELPTEGGFNRRILAILRYLEG